MDLSTSTFRLAFCLYPHTSRGNTVVEIAGTMGPAFATLLKCAQSPSLEYYEKHDFQSEIQEHLEVKCYTLLPLVCYPPAE